MKTNLKQLKLVLLTASLSVLASCAKNSEQQNTTEEQLAGNIVNGANASASFQKENGLVALLITSVDSSGNSGQGLCTGTLISKRIVLTAAHCLDSSDSQIESIAVIFTQNVSKVKKNQVRYAATGTSHELFASSAGGEGAWNDVALIKLSEDAPADFKFTRLPSIVTAQPVAVKMQLIQAGFGKTEALRSVTKDTSGVLKQVSGIEVLSIVQGGKELLLKEDGKGSCNGDSGGPAFAKSADGKLIQVGINSRGTLADSCIGIGVFTNVSAHLQWIQQQSDLLMATK